MEKGLFRHDDILFFALMFAADKPARFRRHAQVKQLSDTDLPPGLDTTVS